MHIEPLERRIAPASITYIDIDGDLVTLTTSKGTVADLEAVGVLTFTSSDPNDPRQLQKIDLSLNSVFAGTNLTVTAKRGPTGGDGFANVGYIDARDTDGGVGLDLGVVTIDGDLGRIRAGDATSATAATKKLIVQSMGAFGTSTQLAGGALVSSFFGGLGALKVAGDIRGAVIGASGDADGDIGSVVIGGSLLGGRVGQAGSIAATGDIGPIRIGGNFEGGTENTSGLITANGRLKSVTIAGSFIGGSGSGAGKIFASDLGPIRIGADLVGGDGGQAGSIQAVTKGSSITIGGSIIGGSALDAGTIISGAGHTAITIAGDIIGGAGVTAGAVTITGAIGKVTVGGSLVGLGPGTGGISSLTSIGAVKIGGNIEGGSEEGSGRIAAPSIRSITMGGSLLGGTGTGTGELMASGTMGPVKILGNIVGASISSGFLDRSGYIEAERIASLFVGGSIIAGADNSALGLLTKNASIRAANDIGPITIRGSVVGYIGPVGETPVIITAVGQPVQGATTDIAIKKITVGGRVELALIAAGYDVAFTPQNPDAQIGAVTVGGDWVRSNLGAGAIVTNGVLGYGDYVPIPQAGEPDGIISRIASITIKGAVRGTGGGGSDHYGFVAQHIVKFKAGGVTYALTPNAGNDNLTGTNPLYVLSSTGDVRLRELVV